MFSAKIIHLVVITANLLASQSAVAEAGPLSGVYQILSGRYNECCGFTGTDSGYDLPSPNQSYVKLTIDPQSSLASMTFLGADMQTVFSRTPCSTVGPLNFAFDYGFVSTNGIIFHVDPGPPPNALFWNYEVSNSGNTLRIIGTLGTVQSPCADVPTRFGHSNVVAELISKPALSVLGYSSEHGARLFLQGHAGHTNVIEGSTDLVAWKPVSTNVMDFSLCPICPYFLFEDFSSTNQPVRFYRAFELW
jgi:hypothetical protein